MICNEIFWTAIGAIGTLLTAVLLYKTLQNQITRDYRENLEATFRAFNEMIDGFTFQQSKGRLAYLNFSKEVKELNWNQIVAHGDSPANDIEHLVYEVQSLLAEINDARMDNKGKEIFRKRVLSSYYRGPKAAAEKTSKLLQEQRPKFFEATTELSKSAMKILEWAAKDTSRAPQEYNEDTEANDI